MGLIKAAVGAAGGVMADQWKEFFYCESMPKENNDINPPMNDGLQYDSTFFAIIIYLFDE